MSRFVSTRGAGPVSFSDALLGGLAPDGGLYLPTAPGRFDAEGPPVSDGFAATARWAIGRLLEGEEAETLARVAGDAFDFDVPLRRLSEGVHLLELFHGPSLAFKDVGARFMARAMAALAPGGGARTVLVATSGDTGGAVARAFHRVEGFRVVVLYPHEGVSERQRRQMTVPGGNVVAVAVAGTFDACQRLAKGAFRDAELRDRCRLTSANSVNVGRLLPQTFYYAHSAGRLGWNRSAPARFVVPSGNLGNLCAGLLAKRAGMPAAGFVAATNRNRAFPDYLETGRIGPRPSVATPSSAMDVGEPSNLERIHWLYHGDRAALTADVRPESASDDETVDAIARAYEREGVVLDPHTAVGYAVLGRLGRPPGPTVLLATAHPAKFPEVVERAVGRPVPVPEALRDPLRGPERIVSLADDPAALRALLLEGV